MKPTILPAANLVVEESHPYLPSMDAESKSQNPSVSAFTDAKGPEEDWTNLPSAESRRKLQNRLNQRASRKSLFLLENYVFYLG